MQIRKSLVAVLFFSVVLAQSVAGQPTPAASIPLYRKVQLPYGLVEFVPSAQPRVGLALSGGGSRGLAQIGALKAFAEYDIPIDFVVGTSMGSIIGGLYATGYPIDELDSIARNTDWYDMLSIGKQINRRELFIDQKITEDRSVLTLRMNGLKPVLPTSVNDGQKLLNYLNVLTLQAPLRSQTNFDLFEVPFRAVCTDLVKGEPVILRSGSLAQAMRASSSVSFLLSPIKIDSLILVDGGLVANVPAGITRQEGADIVLAVNTTSGLHTKEELELPWIVADQVVSIPMKLINEAQNRQADIVIAPDLGSKAANDFSGIDTLIETGYNAGIKSISAIRNLFSLCFTKNLNRDEIVLLHPALGSAPELLRSALQPLFQKDTLRGSELSLKLYQLNDSMVYSDIRITITHYRNFDLVDIEAIPQPRINSFSYSGVTKLDPDTVNYILGTLTGTPYTGKKILACIKNILARYRSIGYSLAELDSVRFDSAAGRISFHLNEGIISEIKITGNEFTNETVIRREIPIKQEDLFLSGNLKQGFTNLRSTNLFDNIYLNVERTGAKNKLIFRVEERQSSLIRFGLKMDNENIPQVSIDLRDENIFGTGAELGLLTYLSDRGKSYTLEQKANRIFYSYFTYNITAFYRFNDIYTYHTYNSESTHFYNRDLNGEYRQIQYGFSFALGRQMERWGNFIIKSSYQIDRIKNLDNTPASAGSIRLVTLRASTSFDTQDRYPYPTNGIRLSGFYETALQAIGSEIGYTNIGGEYQFNIPLASAHTLSSGLKIGFADRTLPLSQQYSLGGQYSFIGMKENEYRGRQIFLATMEYRYKLPVKLFFDTYFQTRYSIGSISEVQEALRLKEFRHSLGFTLSFDTPIGPADFTAGRAFTINSGLSDYPFRLSPLCLYFSIGYYY
jgi:NTE family protein